MTDPTPGELVPHAGVLCFSLANGAVVYQPCDNRYRPAWLTDDDAWLEQLSAMGQDDVDWFTEQWQLADGPPPTPDMSWVTTTRIRW